MGIADGGLATEIDELKLVITDLRESLAGWRVEAERREKEHVKTVKRLEEKVNLLIARSEEKDRRIESLEERVNDLEKHHYEI